MATFTLGEKCWDNQSLTASTRTGMGGVTRGLPKYKSTLARRMGAITSCGLLRNTDLYLSETGKTWVSVIKCHDSAVNSDSVVRCRKAGEAPGCHGQRPKYACSKAPDGSTRTSRWDERNEAPWLADCSNCTSMAGNSGVVDQPLEDTLLHGVGMKA